MPRINLLPWREELRKERQRNFGIAAISAVLLGGLVIWVAHAILQGQINHQQARNRVLEQEIAVLDEQIAEIKNLRQKKDRLLARMTAIEELQRTRPEVVHLFDEMVKTVPEGVHLVSIKQAGRTVEVNGTAESSTRVSAFMRNIENSEWLTRPGLEVVQTVEDGRTRRSDFVVSAQQVNSAAEEEATP